MNKNFKILTDSVSLYQNIIKNVYPRVPKVQTGIKEELNKYSVFLIENIKRAELNDKKTIKIKYINEALINLSMIEVLFRIIKENKYISNNKFMELIQEVTSLRRMTLRWLHSEELQ